MANILDLMDLKQILILHIDGISNRKISETIGIHRNTINSYVKLFNSSKYSKEELLKLEDFEFCKLFPAHTTIKNPRFDELMLFFKNMHEDLSHPGFTFLYHYAEYKGKVKKPYSYTQFMEHYLLSPVINATSKQDKTRPLPLHSFVDKQSAKAAFGVISVDFRVA